MSNRAQAAEWEPRYAGRAEHMRASEIRELLKLLEEPGIISFAGGIPDPALFPLEAARTAYAEVLSGAGAGAALQYSVSEGYQPLRQWIVRHMDRLGVPCDEDNIVITCGSQQALEFLGRVLLSPSDTALVTTPTYLGALQAFSAYEPRYDELRPEQGNRTPASYTERAAAGGGSVKFAYIVPDFANPTGETLSVAARKRLLDLATELDIPIIEDSAYAALRFDGEPLPAIQALNVAQCGSIDRAHTIYCGTFSKTLSPGLRVGWIAGPKPLIRRLVLVKQASDLNSATINQMVMRRLAETSYERQVTAARVHYRRRRDAMLAALERYMPKGATWTQPQGGLFVWVRLPEGCDGAKLLERAVAEAKVAFVPGAAFFFDGRGRNTIRLSYSLPGEEQIDEGIKRLARMI
ncbi:MAG: PLP-dependent aminotransferase family protein [Hyphomicrobiaceae bacterium]|nr:MAG: PLP-dependent aminotransferase family protein [Hyphomicrobiaceae bacterium]